MRNFQRLAMAATTLWVGGLWAIGFIAAPTLFSALSDRALAGMLAGRMFTVMAWVGLVCGSYLLLFHLLSHKAAAFRQATFWIVLAMLLLTMVGHFGVQPIVARLKLEGGAVHLLQGVAADRFARWHGIASLLYLVEALLGLFLAILPPGRTSRGFSAGR